MIAAVEDRQALLDAAGVVSSQGGHRRVHRAANWPWSSGCANNSMTVTPFAAAVQIVGLQDQLTDAATEIDQLRQQL